MEITKNTFVSKIIDEYGDIAEVMQVMGIKKVGNLGFRKILTKLITVRIAAFVHRQPLDEFIDKLNRATFAKRKMDQTKTDKHV